MIKIKVDNNKREAKPESFFKDQILLLIILKK